MEAMSTTRASSPAPARPTQLTSHGLDRCIDAYDAAGQENFDMALRFGLNDARERPHMFLTALARVVLWAGFYARRLVALVLNDAFTIVTVHVHAHSNLAVRTVACGYAIRRLLRLRRVPRHSRRRRCAFSPTRTPNIGSLTC